MRIGEMKESKYIKKEDVGEAGKTLTIRELKHENVAGENQPEEMRYIMFFKEAQKGLVLNWTNIQLAAQICGSEDTDDWTGKAIQLYEDPSISFGGKIVGGVRLRKPPAGSQYEADAKADAHSEINPPPFDDDVPFMRYEHRSIC